MQAAQGVRADRYIVSWAELRQQSKKLQIDLGYVRSKVGSDASTGGKVTR